MDLLTKIKETAAACPFFEYGYVPLKQARSDPWVRELCEQNTCRQYGASWACPPAVGTLEECQARVQSYDAMLLFSRRYTLCDSFDFESMAAGMQDFKRGVDDFQQKLDEFLSGYLLLANEGCGRCPTCTYPSAPCRFPHQLHPSLEGYGFLVKELAVAAGMHDHNGPLTVTYFGALLFSLPPASEKAPL